MTAAGTTPPRSWLTRLAIYGPLLLFAVFVVFVGSQLGRETRVTVTSKLIGQPMPAVNLPGLGDAPGLTSADLKTGKPVLVNVFASWCVPCADEAPLFMQVAKDKRVRIVGINYKDSPENARRFLGRYGNPYAAVGVDASGRAGIEWGVYGVPETFVIGRDGNVAFKLVGPLTTENIDTVLRAEIEKALKKGA